MTTTMVKAENVHKSFGHVEVLKGIDLEVRTGEVFCLLGRSGSGKSTFLRCINHLERIDAGRLGIVRRVPVGDHVSASALDVARATRPNAGVNTRCRRGLAAAARRRPSPARLRGRRRR